MTTYTHAVTSWWLDCMSSKIKTNAKRKRIENLSKKKNQNQNSREMKQANRTWLARHSGVNRPQPMTTKKRKRKCFMGFKKLVRRKKNTQKGKL